MKNIIRAGRNAGKKSRYSQVKSKFDNAFNLKAGQKEASCLCVFNRDIQQPGAKVPLTDAEYGELWRWGVENGDGIGAFVATALREKLAALRPPEVIDVESELDAAQLQSTALHTLLIDAANGNDSGKYNGDIQCGILELIYAVEARLKKAIALASSLMRDEKAPEMRGVKV